MELHFCLRFGQAVAQKTRSIAAAIVVLGLLAASGAAAADRFVDGIEDLPLMPGLENVPQASVAFDTGTGRIVVAFADEEQAGQTEFSAVVDFYRATLPQLGWTAGGLSERLARWTREGEELVLEAVAAGPELVVRFSLSPG